MAARISAPAPVAGEVSRSVTKLVVLFGPEDGTAPTEDEEVDWLIVDRVSIGSGGQRDDVILLHCDLDKAGLRLQDTTTPQGFKRQVEVRILDEDEAPTRVLCWGFVARQTQQLNDAGEQVIYEVRLDRSAYGRAFTTIPVWDHTDGLIEVERPPGGESSKPAFVFNPMIDDIIEGNRSDHQRANGDAIDDGDAEFVPWYYPLDPEQIRTSASETYQLQLRSLWKLGDAIVFLTNWLNPDQTYITNPTSSADTGIDSADADNDALIKNVAIPLGVQLPQALDAMLQPLGYGWYRVFTINDDGERVTKLKFYKRGVGTEAKLLLQRIGENINGLKTNVRDFTAQYSIVDLANTITVYGNYVGVESTWNLVPSWATADDTHGLEELARDQPLGIEKPFVGNKFILDTAGDYINVRAELTEPIDLTELFGHVVPYRRRVFEKCLSLNSAAEDAEQHAIRLDWFDWDDVEAVDPEDPADIGWKRVTWPFSVLKKEAGILFTGPTPPGELWRWFYEGTPEKARLRITAVLRSDIRIVGEAARREQSPNGLDIPLVLYLPDKFEQTSVNEDSIYAANENVARDDQTEITTYAETVRGIEDCAEISCSIPLEGADHPEFRPGCLVTEVSGRNLKLNGYALESGDARYPQVIGLNYIFEGGQYTEVLLESYQMERPE